MTSLPKITISCYKKEIPPFAEPELERLYGSLYSSLAHFRIYGGAEDADTYVARRGEEVIAILLFRREGRRIRVVNEGIVLDAKEVARFAGHVFAAYAGVDAVVFHAVQVDTHGLPFPYQRFNCTEDIVVTLPTTVDIYRASIGNATRKNIKRHLNQLQRDFPSFDFRVYAKEEINEQDARQIIELHWARMQIKNIASSIDQTEMQLIIRMLKERGLLCVATIDGKVCGGTIAYCFGDNYVSRVNAHDPRYNHYRLGMICCYLAICACIDRGGKQFHLRWGEYQYKSALLGVRQELDHLVAYRSRLHLLLNADLALQTAGRNYALRAKTALLRIVKRNDGLLSSALRGLLNAMRDITRLKSG